MLMNRLRSPNGPTDEDLAFLKEQKCIKKQHKKMRFLRQFTRLSNPELQQKIIEDAMVRSNNLTTSYGA